MAFDTTLLAVRNPKWKTWKTVKKDGSGNPEVDGSGNIVWVTKKDGSGNDIKGIECEAKWSHLGDSSQDWLPFTAMADDGEQHGKDLYTALVNGDHGAVEAE